jgi:nitrite reductase/ring-hydroxylating ferredoxin subunit
MHARDVVQGLVRGVESAKLLDAPGKAAQSAIGAAIDPTPVKNALNGVWLGHPAHPLFTDFPIGAWGMAVTLDWLGGKKARPAADRLLAIGVLAAIPAAATGAAQYADFNDDKTRRVGLVHAASNTVALALFATSWWQRKRGRRMKGKAFGLAGIGAMTAGGYLGGHMAFDLNAGVNRAEGSQPTKDELLLVRDAAGRPTHALDARCNHMGGPLKEGEVNDGCVTCPWHGSTFRLDDGSVVRSPAVAPQPIHPVPEGAI